MMKLIVGAVKLSVVAALIAALAVAAGCDAVPPLPKYDGSGSAQGTPSEHHGDPIEAPDGANRPVAEATENAATNQYGGDDVNPAQQSLPSDTPSAPTTPAEPTPPPDDSGGTGPQSDPLGPWPASGCADPSVLTPQQAMECIKQRQDNANAFPL